MANHSVCVSSTSPHRRPLTRPIDEYARTGQSLPRPIPVRKVTVSQLSLLNFTPGADHAYQFPTATLGATELAELEALEAMIRDGATTVPSGTIEKVKKGKKPVYTPMEANTTPIDYSGTQWSSQEA